MKPIEFAEQTVVIAKDQPQYRPLPAHEYHDQSGRIVCCWQLSWRERLRLVFTGKVWNHILTFGQPLQPHLLEIEKPKMGVERPWSPGEPVKMAPPPTGPTGPTYSV